MALDVRFVPLARWIGKPTISRRNATFRATYMQTLDLLERELDHLRAKNVVIEAAFKSNQIRNDGWPYSSARPSAPGVILTFTRGNESVSMPCDTYTTFDDNLRAIALSLEALRAVDRYGVTKSGEQYKGFAQLPPPGGDSQEMDVETAARVLASHTFNIPHTAILNDRSDYEQALKCAQRAAHPDAGGNHEAFVRVQQAKDVLEKHHA